MFSVTSGSVQWIQGHADCTGPFFTACDRMPHNPFYRNAVHVSVKNTQRNVTPETKLSLMAIKRQTQSIISTC
jgi:hypothetical protein